MSNENVKLVTSQTASEWLVELLLAKQHFQKENHWSKTAMYAFPRDIVSYKILMKHHSKTSVQQHQHSDAHLLNR
jgi:hypothetical protein